jgi:hypothetical protein
VLAPRQPVSTARPWIRYTEHLEGDGAAIFVHAGARLGIETVVRALVQFVALTLSEKPKEIIKLLREAALDGLNATKLEAFRQSSKKTYLLRLVPP